MPGDMTTNAASTTEAASKKRRPSMLLGGLLPFDASRLPADVIAGATLAALAIPEVMGYTKIAGTPVITGLYTILLPIIFFAILGSSRHLVVGADSATAAILATGPRGDGRRRGVHAVRGAGVARRPDVRGPAGRSPALLKLGFIANFLSRSVLIGFLTGVGIQVAMGQVGGMFGITGAERWDDPEVRRDARS